ncbi:50S ribosomal protein L24 [candidate division TM6 bacterium RIFCSPHIGHO2_12_FULL_32_22]|nr:MAG: 50S ribosomal protein L24 [candidate division TM6 bacterium RIFCSPHIGHO2_12_FULL_32_22]
MHVKKNDKVKILSGKDEGKVGDIIAILPKKGKVKVKDIAVVTKHTKPRKQGEKAGIVKAESYIDASKVLPICKSCNKPTRVGSKLLEDGKKSRSCKRCGEIF